MSKERVVYFDFLRGVAILMVVAIHTFASTVQQGPLVNDTIVLLRQVLNCAVPLFLAISGYFLAKKKNERSYVQFWKHQIPKIYIPTLIWSVPYFLLYIWQGHDWVKGLVLLFVCGFSVYYFIALIIQYYLLFPLLQKVKMRGVILAFIITMLAISLVSYLSLIEGYNMNSIIKGGPFPVWLVFFVAGIYLGNMKERVYRIWPWLLLLIVGLIFSFFETKWLYPLHHIGYGIKPSSHIYSLAVIVLLFSQKVQALFPPEHRIFRAFAYLGRISFGVYLIHCFFIMLIVHFVHLDWFLLTLVTLLLTVASIHVAQKFFPAVARRVGLY